MTLEVTIRNSALVTSINGGNTSVVLGATAPVTVTIGTFLPVPGPAGPSGSAGSRYTHTQASALATWTANHNLGYRPTVTVFSAGGVEVEATILHVSLNQVQISFNAAVTGTATFV